MTARGDDVLRVVCASVSLVPGSVMEELLALREGVGAFNATQGIRSAFLHASGWLFQWHEGPAAGVEKALRIAQADQRHGRLRELHRSMGPATLTDLLQIVTTHNQEKPTDVARRLYRLKQSQALEASASPDELWMQLVAPAGLTAALGESGLVRRNVVAVTSGNTGAVDLVRSIGQQAGVPVTYQRFATGDPRSADVGAVYVDLPGAYSVTRVHALSRRSLAHPAVRLMLRDLQCLLLLLGDRVDSTSALAGDVGLLLKHLAVRPALRFAAATPDTSRVARECLHTLSADIAEIDVRHLMQAGPASFLGDLLGARQNAENAVDSLLA
ncbi:MAG TPA: BLUF domain-containing protein [Polaromonas sp.]|uniref:BLUF domain-containing protein n=1 Tax=Polaromonas sp. TaxID=1869339 RepID=UPI002D5630C9|nr:BLUF domain-containing protein [Polaromonas sp.]HYW56045.1 BLUF domain-containing protein [Polaromonas sp.]